MDERKLSRLERQKIKTRKIRVVMPRIAIRTDMRAPLDPGERVDQDPMLSRLHWAAPLDRQPQIFSCDREFWTGFSIGVMSTALAVIVAWAWSSWAA